jgi:aspartate aminotransferase
LSELKKLADVLLKYPDILVISDDIYEHLIWNSAQAPHILKVCSALYDRTVVINGVSKAYAMTGWRIGYAAGPAEIINAMKTIQSQTTSNPASISQAAAEAALLGDQSCIRHMVDAYCKRHDAMLEQLKTIPLIRITPSQGTFYNLVDVQAILKKRENFTDSDLSEHLLNEALVAVVPGSAFGAPGTLRLSFAVSDARLLEAVDRIKNSLAVL